ncbi:MAG: outer membrane beta-barrel domain-containing protein, partial [Myxococcaceae bacterium]
AKRLLNSRIFFSVPYWMAMGDLEWSPIYGKVAFFNSILHFDAYLLGGLGAVNTETSQTRGVSVGADLGLGMRFVAKDWIAVNVALINTTYVDQPAGTTKGSTQNVMTLNVGLSLFFPFRSTGRESE